MYAYELNIFYIVSRVIYRCTNFYSWSDKNDVLYPIIMQIFISNDEV